MNHRASIVAAMDKTLRPGHGHAFLALALAGALAACAAPVPPAPAEAIVDVPTAWSANAASVPDGATRLASWWSRFDDPLLTDLIGQALRANTSVTGAQAALRQARAMRDVTAAGLLPTLDGSASAQRARTGNGAAGNTFRAGLDASWELDVFGANRSALDASEAAAQASAASLGDVQVSVAAEVALDYIALRSAQARLAIARQQPGQPARDRADHAVAAAGRPVVVARGRAGARRGRTDQRAVAVAADQHRAERARARGADRPAAGGLVRGAGADAPVPQAADDLALTIPAETLRQRPDVRAAEHQVSAALARVAAGRCGALAELSPQRVARSGLGDAGRIDLGSSVVERAAGQRVVAAVRRRRRARPGARTAGRAGPGRLGLPRGGADGPQGCRGRAGGAARRPRTPGRICRRRPKRPATPRCWRASASAAGWSISRPCSTPSAASFCTQDSVASAQRRRQRRPRAPVQGTRRRLACRHRRRDGSPCAARRAGTSIMSAHGRSKALIPERAARTGVQ